MATTVSDGTTTLTPELLLGYQAKRQSLNIVHEILGGGVAVSLRGTKPRTGTLEFLFLTEDAAVACVDLHEAGSLSLADDDRSSIAMDYVVSGSITISLDDQTREFWTVSVDYQEVV